MSEPVPPRVVPTTDTVSDAAQFCVCVTAQVNVPFPGTVQAVGPGTHVVAHVTPVGRLLTVPLTVVVAAGPTALGLAAGTVMSTTGAGR